MRLNQNVSHEKQCQNCVRVCVGVTLAQSAVLCLTGCLKCDSRVKRMIKLLLALWVQVFITILLAYFCADYSKMISIMFECFYLTQFTQKAA